MTEKKFCAIVKLYFKYKIIFSYMKRRKQIWGKKPVLGILGFSDGDPEVHEQLKDIVQAQVDAIVQALREDGRVEVLTAKRLVNSVESARSLADC